MRCSLAVVVLVSLLAARARAQELRPPRVVHLPELDVPSDVEVPEGGAVEVVVEIDRAGAASMASCDASETLCTLVAATLADARFEPATRDGAPVPARVRVRFRVAEPAPEQPIDAGAPAPGGAAAASSDAGADAAIADLDAGVPPSAHEPSFGATAVVRPPSRGARRLELDEMRDMPGAFGDPFRAIEALPGIVPIVSGLPYFYVRGSPPAGTAYYYDDIPVPALFHLGLGPAVIHPAMVGAVQLHAGVAPARFGRATGGVVVAEGPEPFRGTRATGEAELRLVDVTGMIQAPLAGGSISAGARYGYPGLVLSLVSSDAFLAYWDYASRAEIPIARRDFVQLVWLGSYDRLATLDDDGEPGDDEIEMQFHRLEVRLLRRLARAELGVAVRVGWERSRLADQLEIEALTTGPRVFATIRGGDLSLRVGADFVGIAGDLRVPDPDAGDDDIDPSPDDPTLAAVAARSIAGAYAMVEWRATPRFTFDLGLRGDAWTTGSRIEPALDPRARATYHATDRIDLHAALGLAHQPAVFFIPLPGLADVAIDRGLQRAIQSEVGGAIDLPGDVRAELQLFLHAYDELLFTDIFALEENCPLTIECPHMEPDSRVDGLSYGGEIFVRRPPGEGRLSGFLSYTLSWAEADAFRDDDVQYTPSYDVRHVANLVLQWDLGGGFSAGLRAHARSGKILGEWYVEADPFEVRRHEERLPWFFRADVQASYAWTTSWGALRVALEWMNVTLAREPLTLDCRGPGIGRPECTVEYGPAIFFPNLALRARY